MIVKLKHKNTQSLSKMMNKDHFSLKAAFLGALYYWYKGMGSKGFFYFIIDLLLGWTIIAPIIMFFVRGSKFSKEYFEYLLSQGYEEVDPTEEEYKRFQASERNSNIALAVVVVAIIGLFVATANSAKRTTTADSDTASFTSQENTETNQTVKPTSKPANNTQTATLAKVGEAVQDGDIAFTAIDTTKAKTLGNQYTRKTAQGTFYIVTLKIENKGKETKTIDSSMLTLTDSQGRQFDRSIDGQTAKGLAEGKVDLFLQQVQPGLNVTGDIVFDIPKDATGLKLNVKGGYFGKEKQIELGE